MFIYSFNRCTNCENKLEMVSVFNGSSYNKVQCFTLVDKPGVNLYSTCKLGKMKGHCVIVYFLSIDMKNIYNALTYTAIAGFTVSL